MGTERSRSDDATASPPEPTPKRIKPRVVLGLLLVGSFAGVWLAHLGNSPPVRVLRWTLVTAVGVLAGGLYWRLVLYDDTDFEDDRTLRTVSGRWRRLETVAVWVLAASAVGSFQLAAEYFATEIGTAVLAGVPLAIFGWFWTGRTDDRRGDSLVVPRSILFVVAVGILCGLAWLETRTGPLDWAVRAAHLGSFALWLGGAAWHNGVVVPVVRGDPTAAPALKAQARRFRRHLPVVVVLFFLTGIYQTVGIAGSSFPSLTSSIGSLVWFKLVVLLALTTLVGLTLKRAKGPPGD